MGRYSNSGLAHGTRGAPQITIDENLYKMKISQITTQLNLKFEQKSNQSLTSGNYTKKESKHKNILDKIIALILSLGYAPIIVRNLEMYKKEDIIIKVTYIEEYDYYILEKTDNIFNANKNNFELLTSISNELDPNMILKTVKEILNKL